MIERQFVGQGMKEYLIGRYIADTLSNVGLSHTKLVKTPSGIKIIIYASRPGLIVGRRGANIKDLTQAMKTKFKLENPQIEIAEIDNINLDPQIVAEKITSALERFGTQRFKGIAHRVLSDVMAAGARGIEIVISGKIPGARAKRWRFYAGYLKKCGDIAVNKVKKAITSANLKVGTVGVQVKIMPSDIELPDDITVYDESKIEEMLAMKKQEEEKELAEKKKRTGKKAAEKEKRKTEIKKKAAEEKKAEENKPKIPSKKKNEAENEQNINERKEENKKIRREKENEIINIVKEEKVLEEKIMEEAEKNEAEMKAEALVDDKK